MHNSNVSLLPQFHITGGKGWINDPNGLVFFRGRYHVFFQYNPDDTQWGPMHWGHVAGEDMYHWERLPIALAPGGEGEKDGCFSGSAIVWQNKLWLLYTGYTENSGGDTVRQQQCLAYSEDGIRFEKCGVVIGEEQLPDGYVPSDFRDPKVWQKDGTFFCIVAARRKNGGGRVLMYRSLNLKKWDFVGDVFEEDCPGSMIECPDYIGELNLLTVSETFPPHNEAGHMNVHTNRWFIGKLDDQTGHFAKVSEGVCDYGFDFYAPQTFQGTSIQIGWMNMWERSTPSEEFGFAGMLTIPRRVEMRGNQPYFTPVLPEGTVQKQEVVDGKISDRTVTGVLRIEARKLKNLTLLMRKKEGQSTDLVYENGEFVFNRSQSGKIITGVETDDDSIAGIRRMPMTDENVTLTVVMDRYSVEIFANGRVLTATIYPDADADGLELVVNAEHCVYTRELLPDTE